MCGNTVVKRFINLCKAFIKLKDGSPLPFFYFLMMLFSLKLKKQLKELKFNQVLKDMLFVISKVKS